MSLFTTTTRLSLPLVVAVVLLITFALVVQCEIVQVYVISRHCDRTPISRASVPNNVVDWKKKFGLSPGQLTGLGIAQCQEMGATLRQRYLIPSSNSYISGIVNKYFDSDMFKLHATSVDRTIISLNSACQGLFPNGTGLIDDITNEPSLSNDITMVPVHTVEQVQDITLRAYEKCPKIKSTQNAYKKSKAFAAIEKDYGPLIQDIYNWTGIPITELSNFYYTYDLLNTLKVHNLLTMKPVIDNWEKIDQLGMYSQYMFFSRDIQGNLGAGPLMDLIANSMETAIQSKGDILPKYTHFSAHDTTLQSVMATLNIAAAHPELQNIPPYGSQIIFELHRNDQKQYSVKLIVRLGYNGQFTSYQLPHYCTSDQCEWDQFIRYIDEYSRVSPSNWCHKCGNDAAGVCVSTILSKARSKNRVMTVVLPLVSIALFVVVVILILSTFFSSRGKGVLPINQDSMEPLIS